MAGKRLPARPRSLSARRAQAKSFTDRLAIYYPDAACALIHRNAFELLVATVLSAQTTDERVNSVTSKLFAAYPNAFELAQATQEELENILHPLGFFRAKAKSLRSLAISLIENFDGEVPNTLAELTTLRGVGRKTANVVLGNAFDVPGITVDTHVGRTARRWAWTRETDPVKVEMDIAKLIDPSIWTVTCHRIIAHGRAICNSRNPRCEICPLQDICPTYPLL